MTEFYEAKPETKAMQAIYQEIGESVLLPGPELEVVTISASLAEDSALRVMSEPGLGKTHMAKALATILGGDLGRVQGTADTKSTDITGYEVYNQATRQMEFRKGPIFKSIFLMDDWNRAQTGEMSGLIEAMAEGQVTVGDVSRPTPDNQFIIVTENDQRFREGTRPVPHANSDRFAASISLPELTVEAMKAIRRTKEHTPRQIVDIKQWGPRIRQEAAAVAINDEVEDRAGMMIETLRKSTALDQDETFLSGYRPFDQILRLGQARALLYDRLVLSPSDVDTIGRFVLSHRVKVDEDSRLSFDQVYGQTLGQLPPISNSAVYRDRQNQNPQNVPSVQR